MNDSTIYPVTQRSRTAGEMLTIQRLSWSTTQLFRVTRNLFDALERLSIMRVWQVCRLWVDALCINQGDNQERGQQVQLMQTIYSKATKVLAWIGKYSEDSSQAMVALKRMPSATSSARNSVREKLERLFAGPYWKRIWIIQEVAVAQKVRILCGTDQVTFDELDAASHVYEMRPRQMPLDNTNYSYIKNISMFRQKIRNESPISLLEAMLASHQALSSVPHDKIFALRGLCHNGLSLVPSPDYEQSFEHLLLDITQRLVVSNKCWDILFAAAHSSKSSLPSWAPDWREVRVLAAVNLRQLSLQPHYENILGHSSSDPEVLSVTGFLVSTVSTGLHYVWDYSLIVEHLGVQDAICECLFYDSLSILRIASNKC